MAPRRWDLSRFRAAFALGPAALALLSCAQTPTTVPVRSLERSGAVSFVCLRTAGDPDPRDGGDGAGVGLPLEQCTNQSMAIAVDDYSVPHLIALVTQTTRGEVAAIDVTAGTVLDSDHQTPGFNFLPVGGTPTEIASTPDGEATFVGIGQPGLEGIFAIPSRAIPRGATPDEASPQPAPSLKSWPACRLPVAPGAMTVMVASPAAGVCNGKAAPQGPPFYAADLAAEAEPGGARMLIVTLPELGEVDVIDAMAIVSSNPGDYDACPVVKRIPLAVDRANAGPIPPAPGVPACTPAKAGFVTVGSIPVATPAKPHPGSLASASGDSRIFVGDEGAPVIHVLDGATPCDLQEGAPLLPSSIREPDRAVVTSNVAVSPLTSSGSRYLYAVDALGGGTVMVFDVSSQASSRAPLHLFNSDRDPFSLPDRIQVGGPARAITFAKRDPPNTTILTAPALDGGPQPSGILCDPTVPPNSGPLGSYLQTASDFTYGAGPHTMRGIFALLTLDNGEIAVVDIEDYDQLCRRPVEWSSSDARFLGCGDIMPPESPLNTKGEVSCNVVETHHVRSAHYFLNDPVAGDFAPSMQSAPVLRDFGGSVLGFDEGHPKLLGPQGLEREPYASLSSNLIPIVPVEAGAPDAGAVPEAGTADGAIDASMDASVAASSTPSPSTSGSLEISASPAASKSNWVAFDMTEPRAHVGQTWFMTYEGTVAPFNRNVGQLQCREPHPDDQPIQDCTTGLDLVDPSALFCGAGVHGEDVAPKPEFADVVQITDNIPDPSTEYWQSPGLLCDYNRCLVTFGRADSLSTANLARDIVIKRAFQDRLELASTVVHDATKPVEDPATVAITCCFPSPPTYTVRAKGHWIVGGTISGVAHHVIADASDNNHCIDSCDPTRALQNGRAYDLPPGAPVPIADDPDPTRLFRNPQMQFAIWKPADSSDVARDTAFSFTETGGFGRLSVSLAQTTSLVAPQDAVFLPSLGVLAVADGASLGLVLVDPTNLTGLRFFY